MIATQLASGSTLLNPRLILEGIGIAEGMRVADLGCGPNGFFILEAARLIGDRGVAYAVDVRREVLEQVTAKARLAGINNVTTVWSDLEIPNATALPPESLDLTLIIDTLYLVHERRAVIAEGLRLTKPGGKLVIIEWKQTATPLGPDVSRRVNRDEILALAEKMRVTVRGAFEPGQFHWGITLEKT